MLKCPDCESTRVTLALCDIFMANTLDFYCHSLKPQDSHTSSSCLDCFWHGYHFNLKGFEDGT